MSFSKKTLFLCIIPLLAFSAHKYYLSLTQIKYNQEEKSIEIIINVFMDDIETTLNNEFDIDLQLTTKKELKDSDRYFSNYLKEKLQIKVNNKELEFNYLGKEYDGDLIYFYLEMKEIENITSFEIINQILTKEFLDQQNVVKMKVGNKKVSKILTKKNDKALLNF
tara:strand:+ start:1917 stop:2414 length:498 start_codon:yes stop_codon:yes gene_type:complete